MPLFFFNLHDGAGASDRTGVELIDADKAHDEAVASAGEMLPDRDVCG